MPGGNDETHSGYRGSCPYRLRHARPAGGRRGRGRGHRRGAHHPARPAQRPDGDRVQGWRLRAPHQDRMGVRPRAPAGAGSRAGHGRRQAWRRSESRAARRLVPGRLEGRESRRRHLAVRPGVRVARCPGRSGRLRRRRLGPLRHGRARGGAWKPRPRRRLPEAGRRRAVGGHHGAAFLARPVAHAQHRRGRGHRARDDVGRHAGLEPGRGTRRRNSVAGHDGVGLRARQTLGVPPGGARPPVLIHHGYWTCDGMARDDRVGTRDRSPCGMAGHGPVESGDRRGERDMAGVGSVGIRDRCDGCHDMAGLGPLEQSERPADRVPSRGPLARSLRHPGGESGNGMARDARVEPYHRRGRGSLARDRGVGFCHRETRTLSGGNAHASPDGDCRRNRDEGMARHAAVRPGDRLVGRGLARHRRVGFCRRATGTLSARGAHALPGGDCRRDGDEGLAGHAALEPADRSRGRGLAGFGGLDLSPEHRARNGRARWRGRP